MDKIDESLIEMAKKIPLEIVASVILISILFIWSPSILNSLSPDLHIYYLSILGIVIFIICSPIVIYTINQHRSWNRYLQNISSPSVQPETHNAFSEEVDKETSKAVSTMRVENE